MFIFSSVLLSRISPHFTDRIKSTIPMSVDHRPAPDRWVDFYRPYFPTPRDAQNFVAACNVGEAGAAAKEIMQHSRRLILLADDVARVRPGRDALPLLFLIVCAEHASKRLDGSGKGFSAHHVRNFFSTCLSEAERTRLGEAFTATDGSSVDAAAAVDVLYQVRNKIAHEGVYWEFAFSRPGGRAGDAPVQAAITREEFRAMVARGCIRAAKRRLEPAPARIHVEAIADPAEHDAQQRDWAGQRRLHAEYLAQQFTPRCPGAEFTMEDWAVLREKGSWMEALATGAILPLTSAQHSFVDAANRRHAPANHFEELWERYSLLAAYFRVAPWFNEDVDDSDGSELYDGDLEDYLDHDSERDLIAAELDDYAESWSAADEEGWFYDDDDEENEAWDDDS
jgi:uncharacterized protein YifE (UPF0438 family)